MRNSANCNNYPGFNDIQGSEFSMNSQNFIRKTNTMGPNNYQGLEENEEEKGTAE